MTSGKATTGVNDLKTLFPEIAKEADGWNPNEFKARSNKKVGWICASGHKYSAVISNRTRGNGCPYCCGRIAISGVNDLAAVNPILATEANGWDPSKYLPHSNLKLQWKCRVGHEYSATINNRSNGKGCPYCSGQKVLVGFNDLATTHPELATECSGWNPRTLTRGSTKKLQWRCSQEHVWNATILNRTIGEKGCPYCKNRKLLCGFNDLATKFPEVAAEAHGWDPTTVLFGSNKNLQWRCNQGHIWATKVSHRTGVDSGCPACAERGFNPSADAWFYLMSRPGEQQIGISNNLRERFSTHAKRGWQEIDFAGPFPGQEVLSTERLIKIWLRQAVGLIEGTTENWSTSAMEVHSLGELKRRSGIKTDIF